jgi:coproporphyrinogen III oxidase
MHPSPLRDRVTTYFGDLQDRIVAALERLDGQPFRVDSWQREGGGGGRSCVLMEGGVFEKAGVNFSDGYGEMNEEFSKQVPGEGRAFTACGLSLVLHPRNPMAPTVHTNFRFLVKGDRSWFGGGADLTPYYPYREDVVHFHQTWRRVCLAHAGVVDYPRLKTWCDEYFFLPHRNEARGVGGIFFDYLEGDLERVFAFVRDAGDAFLDAYLPIAEKRKGEPYTEAQKEFQEYRRGRYVEFNLVYDRGTVFGLKTGGRIESILMSLPAKARWWYDYQPAPGSREAELTEYWLKPRDWAGSERDEG